MKKNYDKNTKQEEEENTTLFKEEDNHDNDEKEFKPKNLYYLLTYGGPIEILSYNLFNDYLIDIADFSKYHIYKLKDNLTDAHICWPLNTVYDKIEEKIVYTCLKHQDSCIIFSNNLTKCASIVYDLHHHIYQNFMIYQIRTNQQYYVKIKNIHCTMEQDDNNEQQNNFSYDYVLNMNKQIIINLSLIDNNVQLFSTHQIFDKKKYKQTFNKMNYTKKLKSKKLKKVKTFKFTKQEYEKQETNIEKKIGIEHYDKQHMLENIYTTGDNIIEYYQKPFVKIILFKQDYQAVNFLNFYILLKNQLLQESKRLKTTCIIHQNNVLKSHKFGSSNDQNNEIKIWLAKPYYEDFYKHKQKINLSMDSFFENLLLDNKSQYDNNFFFKSNDIALNEQNVTNQDNYIIYVPCSNIFNTVNYNYDIDFYDNILMGYNHFKANNINEIEKNKFIYKDILTLITLIWIPVGKDNNFGILCFKYFENEYEDKIYYCDNNNIKKKVEKYQEIFKKNRNNLQHLFSMVNLFDIYNISIFYNIDSDNKQVTVKNQ